MTRPSPQRPIGSGFGAATTAAEVLAGLDLSGRLAIVTGGYGGLGLETTRVLTAAGARVIVPARRPSAARETLTGNASVEVDEMDLADLDSVAAFAARVLDSGRRIDLIVDNAGIMACPETRVGPGWELQFATNHLGHFALVNRLMPALADDARVVSVSSLHPGGILTDLPRHLEHADLVAMGAIDEDGNEGPMMAALKTVEQGAATQTWAATSPQLSGLGGLYLEDCEVAEMATAAATGAADVDGGGGVQPWAIDPDEAARLWALSAELTGVDGLRAAV